MKCVAPPDPAIDQTERVREDRAHQPKVDQIDLSIVIVNWNTEHVIGDCLESVFRYAEGLQAEVIVVDNASTDGSVELIRREHPNATLIANDENMGFAGANNQGMRIARGRHVLLLNPDTVVLDNVFTNAIAYAEAHPEVGVVGCQVMESETAIQRTCFRFPSPLNTLLWVTGANQWMPEHILADRATYGPWDRESHRDVDVVSGMFMLTPRAALEDVGLMDEDYFVYAEEADWCHRFHAAGWTCVFAPVGRILHVDGGSKSTEQASVRMYVEMQKNMLLFHRKRLGVAAWATAKALFSCSMLARAVWFTAGAVLTGDASMRHRARQSVAASKFHWMGKEPAW